MAATAQWKEDNGAGTGSPSHGTTRGDASDVNWKDIDDTGTSYSSKPIIAGNNSYEKYQYIKFTGTFNEIKDGLFAHTSGSLGTGLTLKGKVSSSYSKPSTSAISGASDITSTKSIGNGKTVKFSTTGPEDSSPSSSITATGYTQYIVTQLQTQSTASPGDTNQQTLTVQWHEN